MYLLPVSPSVKTRISDAEPITIPRAVRAKRTRLVLKLSNASLTISLNSIVRLALARVLWNERVPVRKRRWGCSLGGVTGGWDGVVTIGHPGRNARPYLMILLAFS